ncbi:MAG: AGE family epimerase/isomerase [Pseudomonadota bacterium]|nr:AGE family epimerase/isomerase [Pseudomonadota bacterium]
MFDFLDGFPTPERIGTELQDWLVHQALPRWIETGIDRERGGFFERLDRSGRAVEAPRRTRVVARQIYVFATAARRGWHEEADRWVEHGLRFLCERLRLADGTFARSIAVDRRGGDSSFDLYEQAFALFALASACRGRPDRAALRGMAEELLATLRENFAHPHAGFEEARPRTLPLRANPHMHLLEAALAWVEISHGDDRTVWVELADELVALCLDRFVAPKNGALRENFDGDWRPLSGPAGQLVEPGHQFEWAWLLGRWAESARGQAPACAAARRLRELGEAHGVDGSRGVAVNALDTALATTDAAAKLWPQTERVRAWVQAWSQADTPSDAALARGRLVEAARGLARYLLPAPAGLWEEQMGPDGRFDGQESRASSLYHIVAAIESWPAPAVGSG